MENKTKKNKTAVVAKTKERRISNKKVESFHKYWEAFPGLKKRLFLPVEGENYSIIKPKNVEKTVKSNASVKKAKEFFDAFAFNKGESLAFSLKNNTEDGFPDILKNVIKNDVRLAYSDMPFINLRKMLKTIDFFWPLVEEYHKTYKDGGIMALTKHPLFISAAKCFLAEKMEKEESLKLYSCSAVVDYMFEKGKYVSFSDEDLELYRVLKKRCLYYEAEWELTDEEITAKLNRLIENLNENETNIIVNMAFFMEIRCCIKYQFQNSIGNLIYKLSA